MEPIKGGALINLPQNAVDLLEKQEEKHNPAAWALYFAASHPMVMMVLSGMNTIAQMEDNILAMRRFKSLDKTQADMLLQVAKIIRKTVSVPCTACGYCLESCPKNIPIPDILEQINDLFRFGEPRRAAVKNAYGFAVYNKGKASDCIYCGVCETLCPQHIEIRNHLKQAAKDFE
jgi:predicted aldo/keto reductase-like oxidoreductase